MEALATNVKVLVAELDLMGVAVVVVELDLMGVVAAACS
jgi:hypothetical protein